MHKLPRSCWPHHSSCCELQCKAEDALPVVLLREGSRRSCLRTQISPCAHVNTYESICFTTSAADGSKATSSNLQFPFETWVSSARLSHSAAGQSSAMSATPACSRAESFTASPGNTRDKRASAAAVPAGLVLVNF